MNQTVNGATWSNVIPVRMIFEVSNEGSKFGKTVQKHINRHNLKRNN